MTKCLDANGWIERSIGDHQIELVDGQLGEQLVRLTLTAYKMNRIREFERGKDQSIGNEFGNDIGDPDCKARCGAPQRSSADYVAHLASTRKDFVGILESDAASLRQGKIATLLLKEFDSQRFF